MSCPSCAQIYVRVLTDTFTWVPPDRHREADFYAAAREEEIFVALDGDRIIGMAALYRPQRFLHSLYVTERGRGVGKALLDHVIAAAGGKLSLKCQAANTAAQAFYVREGFRCTEAGRTGRRLAAIRARLKLHVTTCGLGWQPAVHRTEFAMLVLLAAAATVAVSTPPAAVPPIGEPMPNF
jgi:GNAT superfamily N-acetyltransferase